MNSNIKKIQKNKLLIEKYFTYELDSSETAEAETLIKNNSDYKKYLEFLNNKKQQFHLAHPFGSFLDAAEKHKSNFFYTLFSPFIQPALRPVFIVLILLVIGFPFYISFNKTNQTIRMKGTEEIGFICRRNGIILEKSKASSFMENDEIQVIYTTTDSLYLSIFSIDIKEIISFYHPDRTDRWCSIKTGIGAGQYYPASIVLDSSSGQELIVALFTKLPVKSKYIKQQVEKFTQGKESDIKKLRTELISGKVFKGNKVLTLLLNKE